MRKYITGFLLLLVSFVSGCGGGGGVSTPSPAPPQSSGNTVTVKVPPNQAVTVPIENGQIVVPTGTFPNGGQLLVTQDFSNSVLPCAGWNIRSAKANLTVSVSTAPAQEIYLDDLRGKKRSKTTMPIFANFSGGRWQVISAGSWGQSKLTLLQAYGMTKVSGILGDMTKPASIGPAKLIPVAENLRQEYQPTDLVLVHGFNAKPEDMRKAAEKFAATGRFCNVYLLSYDWTQDMDQSAREFHDLLKMQTTKGHTIGILAHSMGVVVSRPALEKFGNGDLSIFGLYAVCGANLGSVWANVADLVKWLQCEYLNLPADQCPPTGIISIDAPVVKQLVKNSAYLKALNNPAPKRQRISVPEVYWGDRNDMVVGYDSGVGTGIKFSELTNGPVNAYSTNGFGHSGLIQTDAGIDKLISDLYGDPIGTWVGMEPNQSYFNDEGNCWESSLRIYNDSNSGYDATLLSLTIDGYDANGDWLGTAWYDQTTPVGGFFPCHGIENWNKTIRCSEGINVKLKTYIDAGKTQVNLAPDNLREMTQIIRLQRSEHGKITSSFMVAHLCHNGTIPKGPKTRLPMRAGGDFGSIFVGPG